MPNAETIFNVVFFVVLLSVLGQGTTIVAAARRLGLATPLGAAERYPFDAVIAGDAAYDLRELTIGEAAPAVGRDIAEGRFASWAEEAKRRMTMARED